MISLLHYGIFPEKSRRLYRSGTFLNVRKAGCIHTSLVWDDKVERADPIVHSTRRLASYYFSAMISISKSSVDNLSFRLKAPSFAP